MAGFGPPTQKITIPASVAADGTLVVLTRQQAGIENGLSFRAVSSRVSAAVTEECFLLIAGANAAHIDKLIVHFGDSGALWEIYTGPTVTGNGTALTAIKLNQTSTTAATLAAYSAPTVSDAGTLAGVFQTSGAGGESWVITDFIKLAASQKLLVRRTAAGAGTQIGFTVEWTEVV